MQDFITLPEVLKSMRTPVPFDITFYTADKARDKGGEIVELNGVVVTSSNYPHAIRKVMLPNGQYKDLHIYLIRTFNGKRVYI